MRTGARWTVGRPALILAGALALAAPAAAHADDTWSGASTSSSHWSDGANWSGGVAPTSPAGTLTFPDLGRCASTPATCYATTNDLPALAVTGLTFTNTTAGTNTHVLGNGLTLGAGGITHDSGGGTSVTLNTPLTLDAAQTWTVGKAGSYDSVSLAPPAGVSGGFPVNVSFPAVGRGDLYADSDMEVGPVTVTGIGGLHIGSAPAPAGSGRTPGSVNGSDGQSVSLSGGATLTANPGATVGPLTLTGASLLLGTSPTNTLTTTLAVTGAASLASATTTTTFINDNGATPGTDYSQLSATGDISLGGRLVIGQGLSNGSCVALHPGDVATLVSSTGTRSGTYSNAPAGTVLTMSPSCQGTPAQVRIAYTATGVTGTIVTGTPTPTPTSTSLSASPSAAVTNQPVTLTATVSTLTAGTTPDGTVAFASTGGPISGCGGQPVTGSGSTATATCTTSFAARTSPESLTADFTGAAASGQASSSSKPQSLPVNPDATTTAVTVSTSHPAPGADVTYTATVTPAHGGPSSPTGTVRFLDAGQPISGCAAQTLSAGPPSVSASCTLAYPSAGSHTITAAYGGDANFAASPPSPPVAVTVGSGPAPTPGPGPTPGPAPGPTPTPGPTPGPTGGARAGADAETDPARGLAAHRHDLGGDPHPHHRGPAARTHRDTRVGHHVAVRVRPQHRPRQEHAVTDDRRGTHGAGLGERDPGPPVARRPVPLPARGPHPVHAQRLGRDRPEQGRGVHDPTHRHAVDRHRSAARHRRDAPGGRDVRERRALPRAPDDHDPIPGTWAPSAPGDGVRVGLLLGRRPPPGDGEGPADRRVPRPGERRRSPSDHGDAPRRRAHRPAPAPAPRRPGGMTGSAAR